MMPRKSCHPPIPATIEILDHSTIVIHIQSEAVFALMPSRWSAERIGAQRVKGIRDIVADGRVEFRIADPSVPGVAP